MMRRMFLHRVEGGGAKSYDDRVCGATSCIIMEVGEWSYQSYDDGGGWSY